MFAGDFNVVIDGFFPGAEGKQIRLMKYADQITYVLEEIDDTIVADDGFFSFSFSVYEPVYVFYRIDHARMGHYVEPGNNYNIEFEPVDFDTLDDRRNPYINPWHFQFSLYNEEIPDGLNNRITDFNNTFDDFLLEHFSNVSRRRLHEPFKNFKAYTDSLFQIDTIDNSFFKDYYEYKFAFYYRIANIKSPLHLYEEYIINRPVLYENPQYMDFFNTVFDKYLFAGSRNITVQDLLTTVNRHNSYNALMDSLGKDTILRNEVLRELVMLKGLKDLYYHDDFNERNVYSIVKHAREYSKFPEHRAIAGNILKRFTHMQEGHPAPAFQLKNRNGEVISLDDFQGKFVLLNFWTTWCVPCLAEFSVMEDIYEEYNDQLEILSISADRNEDDFIRFVENNHFPWDFLYFDDNFNLLDDYEVRRFPLFILIGPDGNIMNNVAPFPSRGLKNIVNRAVTEWNRRRQ